MAKKTTTTRKKWSLPWLAEVLNEAIIDQFRHILSTKRLPSLLLLPYIRIEKSSFTYLLIKLLFLPESLLFFSTILKWMNFFPIGFIPKPQICDNTLLRASKLASILWSVVYGRWVKSRLIHLLVQCTINKLKSHNSPAFVFILTVSGIHCKINFDQSDRNHRFMWSN